MKRKVVDVVKPYKTIYEYAQSVLQNPDEWLKAPNSQFGGRPPIELIGTNEEEKVFNILNAVDLGLF